MKKNILIILVTFIATKGFADKPNKVSYRDSLIDVIVNNTYNQIVNSATTNYTNIYDYDLNGDNTLEFSEQRLIGKYRQKNIGFFTNSIQWNNFHLTDFNNKLTLINNGKSFKTHVVFINAFDVIYNAKISLDKTTDNTGILDEKYIEKYTNYEKYEKDHYNIFKEIRKRLDKKYFDLNYKSPDYNLLVIAKYQFSIPIRYDKLGVFSTFYWSKDISEEFYSSDINWTANSTEFEKYVKIQKDRRNLMKCFYSHQESRYPTFDDHILVKTAILNCLDFAYANYALNDDINKICTVAEVKTKLNNLSDDQYAILKPFPTKYHILSLFVRESMLGNWGGNISEEEIAIKVVKNTISGNDAYQLLEVLKSISQFKITDPNNVNKSSCTQISEASSKPLYRSLIYRIDDGMFGSNYEKFNIAVKDLVNKSQDIESRLTECIADFENRKIHIRQPAQPNANDLAFDPGFFEGAGGGLVSYTDDDKIKVKLKRYVVPEPVTHPLFSAIVSNEARGNSYFDIYKDAFSIINNDSYDPTQSVQKEWDPLPSHNLIAPYLKGTTYSSAPPPSPVKGSWQDVYLTFEPFELIMVEDHSGMETIEAVLKSNEQNGGNDEVAGLKQGTYVPAIFLKYATDKMRNRNLAKIADFVIDVATIAGTGGAWALAKGASKLVKLRKAWVLYNTISSGISLVINVAGLEDIPAYKKYVKWFQFSQMLTGGGDMLYNGSKNFFKYLNRSSDVKNITEVKQGALNFADSWIEAKGLMKEKVITGKGDLYEILETRNDALALEIYEAFANGSQKHKALKTALGIIDQKIEDFFTAVINLKNAKRGTVLYSSIIPFSNELFTYTAYTIGYILKHGKDKITSGYKHFEDFIKNNGGPFGSSHPADYGILGKLKNEDYHNAILNLMRKYPDANTNEKVLELLSKIGIDASKAKALEKIATEQKQLVAFSEILNKLSNTTNAETLLAKLSTLGIKGDDLIALATSLAKSDDLAKAAKADPSILEYWQLLNKAGRSKLINNYDAIMALKKASSNPKLQSLGFTKELLAKVKASRLDDGDFVNILADLDAFGIKAATKPSLEFDNFGSLIGKLTDNNTQNSQAAHWIVQDMTANIDEFAGKKWKFEGPVTNSDGNAAFIDAVDNSVPPKRIEYKWLTSKTVSKDDFIREFVKRDLFNTTNLNTLQWRIKGQKLTKEIVKGYLESQEGITALKKISAAKANSFLGRNDLSDVSDIGKTEIANEIIKFFNNDVNFNAIFK